MNRPLLYFWFNCFVIVCIGAGGTVAQNLGFGHFTDKQHMTAQILLTKNLAGKHRVCILRHIQQAVAAALCLSKTAEFVHIPAGLHSEITNGLKGDILCQHTDIEHTAVFDHLPGQIAGLYGNCQFCRVVTYLKAGIGNAPIVFFLIPGTQNKQSIGQIKQRFRIFSR